MKTEKNKQGANSAVSTRTSTGSSKDAAIYEHLRAAIIGNHLEPGTKLPEDSLAEAFSISRTSVRKVLQRLEHERLVDIRMHHGASVAQPTLKDARDLFATRKMIECGAMSQVVTHITEHDIELLQQLIDGEDAAEAKKDRASAIFLSGQFHIELVRISQNEIITTFLSDLVARTSLVLATFGAPSACTCPPSHHKELIKLLEAKDAKSAEKWMRQHLVEIEESIIARPDPDKPLDLRSVLDLVSKELNSLAVPPQKRKNQT